MVELVLRVEPRGAVRTREQMSGALAVHSAHLHQERGTADKTPGRILLCVLSSLRSGTLSESSCNEEESIKRDFTGLRPRLRGAAADVWMRWCLFKVGAWENFLSQTLQL